MSINWSIIYSQGRCKAIGIPWSEEEKNAIHVEKVPVEYVRQGCLTQEEYTKASGKREADEKRTGKVQLVNLRKNQLYALCQKHGVSVTDEAPRASMIEVLLLAGLPKIVPIGDVPEAKD